MTWLGATLLGLPYAGALALIAGVGELVPNLGPIIAAVAADHGWACWFRRRMAC